eukprot:5590696-Pleurochrysis_carterae.AAC.2
MANWAWYALARLRIGAWPCGAGAAPTPPECNRRAFSFDQRAVTKRMAVRKQRACCQPSAAKHKPAALACVQRAI